MILDWKRVFALQELYRHTKGSAIELIDADHVKWIDYYNQQVTLVYDPKKASYFKPLVDNSTHDESQL